MEGRQLILGQVILDDLLHAVGADHRRYAHIHAVFAVLAVQQGADGNDCLLVVQDRSDQTAERRADAVLGAALAIDRHPGVGDRLLFDLVIVKDKAAVLFCQICQRLTAKGDLRPGDHDGIAVLAHHAARNGIVGHTRLLEKDIFQTRRVQTRARSEYMPAGKPGQPRDLPRDHIAGIGDIDPEPVEAARDHLGHIICHLRDREIHLIQPVMIGRRQKLDLSDRIDDDIHIRQLIIFRGIYHHSMRAVGDGVPDILHLTAQLGLLLVHKNELIHKPAQSQSIGTVRSHMTKTDDSDFSFFQHRDGSFLKYISAIPRYMPAVPART